MGIEATKKLGYAIWIVICIVIAVVTMFTAIPANANESAIKVSYTLILPVLLIINLIIAIYWIIKKEYWFLLNIIAIAVNFNFLSAMFQFNSNQDEDYNIKLLTYNVSSFNNDFDGYTAKNILNYAKEQKVNVICFQEYFSRAEYNVDSITNLFKKEYPFYAIPNLESKNTQVAIFSKFPITGATFIPFKGTYNCAMWSDLSLPNGKVVRLFNQHLQTTALNYDLYRRKKYGIDTEGTFELIKSSLGQNMDIRTAQAEKIKRFVMRCKLPKIVAGDFNSIPSQYPYQIFNSILKDGFKECGHGYGYTYRGILKLLRIDYIFTSTEFKGVNYYSDNKPWSEHNPVIMEMRIN